MMTNPPPEMRGEQLAPHSVEAEEAVLGSVLINPESRWEVMAFLTGADFFIVRHTWIWEAITGLSERRDPIDYLTVVNELEQMNKLTEVGGSSYILRLVNKTPSALNVEGYGRIVERMATRRRLLEAAGLIARKAHSDETDIEEVVSYSIQAVTDAVMSNVKNDIVSIGSIAVQIFENQSSGAVDGVPIGLIDAASIVKRWRNGNLIIIAGRPGMGKSALLDTLTLSAAEDGYSVGFLSLEMPTVSIATRFISASSGIPYEMIDDSAIPVDKWDDFTAAVEKMNTLPIHFSASSSMTMRQIETTVRLMVHEHGIDMLMVDYIQLIAGSRQPGDNRETEVSGISRTLKQLAMEYNIPVVAAAQVGRACEARTDKRPMLSDLRESGALEQDADVVGFLYRHEYYYPGDPKPTEFIIAKQRNGPTGIANLHFDAKIMLFKNAEKTYSPVDQYIPGKGK